MTVTLWDKKIPYAAEGYDTPNTMKTYFVETDTPRPCVVVFAGGGYSNRAPHEGGPVALRLNKHGIHAVVVDYRVAPYRFPTSLLDAQRAIRLLRAHAEEWKIDPEKIVTLGFSAGGHLCGLTAVWGDALDACPDIERDEIDRLDCRVNGAILCYAVLSFGSAYGHVGSGENLLGENYRYEQEAFELSDYVTKDTPPCFLWHTSEDPGVSVKNSLLFSKALAANGVPFELHVYPYGTHGLGLADDYRALNHWCDLAGEWVNRL